MNLGIPSPASHASPASTIPFPQTAGDPENSAGGGMIGEAGPTLSVSLGEPD